MSSNEPNARDGKKRGKTPYWMKNVEPTPDLVLRYQIRTKDLEEALKADLRVLRELNQVRFVADFLKLLKNFH